MILSSEDRKLFFRLWLPLVQFSSLVFDIHTEDLVLPEGGMNHAAAVEVAEAIWQDTSIIDEYLAARDDLTRNERRIVMRWKKAVYGQFVVERHLQDGSIFISLQNQNVYLVKGLTDTFPELLHGCPMPTIAITALLPFKNDIIADGTFKITDVSMSPEHKRVFEEYYMNAERNKKIISTSFQWC